MSPKLRVRNGAIVFIAAIALAYGLYPHWVTFSHFATHWYTLIPFVIAMGTCVALLALTGRELRQHKPLRTSGNILIASAVSASLIVCIPYMGSATQKAIHNTIVLIFVVLGALGIALIAKHLKNMLLGAISATMIAICLLELVLLARYNAHPVVAWVWTVLQLILTPLLIYALYVIADILEQKREVSHI